MGLMSDKFRAWHEIEHKMIYFTLNHLLINYCDEFNYCSISDTDLFRYHQDIENLDIMRYTGFKDKKGNEIYGGDIIHRPYIGVPMIVRWNEENACFDLTREPDNFKSTMLWYTRDCHKDYEIIGNIYEHPELLKV